MAGEGVAAAAAVGGLAGIMRYVIPGLTLLQWILLVCAVGVPKWYFIDNGAVYLSIGYNDFVNGFGGITPAQSCIDGARSFMAFGVIAILLCSAVLGLLVLEFVNFADRVPKFNTIVIVLAGVTAFCQFLSWVIFVGRITDCVTKDSSNLNGFSGNSPVNHGPGDAWLIQIVSFFIITLPVVALTAFFKR